jgi:predicted site-specific integrase-resolvase
MNNTRIKKETKVEDLVTDRNRLLNEKLSAQLLGVSQQTLRQSIRYKGLIQYFKVNARISYRYGDILDYLEKCRVAPTN